MEEQQIPEHRRLEWLDRRSELLAALLLSLATLASSWAGFQSALWDGEQAASYAHAEQTRTRAANAETEANQYIALDVYVFGAWLDAWGRDDRQIQDFYREQFRPELAAAFERWRALRGRDARTAPKSPFALPSYLKAIRREAIGLHAAADRHFAEGERANDYSDAYVQATVILALSLFMGGIIQAFNNQRLRLALLGVGALCWLLGMARILFLPALRLTLGA